MTATAPATPYLIHVHVDESETVETVEQLQSALKSFRDADYSDLTETYVVERIEETMSDRTAKHSIRIREAQRIA